MITTLTGKNTFLLQQARQELVNDFVKSYGDFGLESIDAEDAEPQKVYDAVTNLPFLVEKKLVVLNRPSSNKALAEKLPEWLEAPHDNIDVLIIEPEPDKRTAWFKFLQKSTQLRDFAQPDEFALKKWAGDYIVSNKGSIDRAAVEELLNRVGPHQQQLFQELNKLLAYNLKIDQSSVELLVEPLPQDTVFTMLDALVAGDVKKVFALYDSLRLGGVDPHEVLGMLAWQLHTLALVKSAHGDAAATGLHPYVVRKNTALTSRLTMTDIKKLVDDTCRAELNIKQKSSNAHEAVTVLLLELTSTLAKIH